MKKANVKSLVSFGVFLVWGLALSSCGDVRTQRNYSSERTMKVEHTPTQTGTDDHKPISMDPMAERMWKANAFYDSLRKSCTKNGITHWGMKEDYQLDSFHNAMHKDDFIPGQDLSTIIDKE